MSPRTIYVDRHPARFGEFLRARQEDELSVLVPRRLPAPLRALLRQLGDVRGTLRLHVARGCRRRRNDAALADFWAWAHSEQLWFSDDLEAIGFRVCPDARSGGVNSDDVGEWLCARSSCQTCRAFHASGEAFGVYLE